MSLHLQLDQPSSHQLKTVVHRYFFALDMDTTIKRTTESCHQCCALESTPRHKVEQSTTCPPDAVGIAFAAVFLKRERQLMLNVIESVSSYTVATLIENGLHNTFHDALITLCISLRS